MPLVSVYASTNTSDYEAKRKFYKALLEKIKAISKRDLMIMGGDLNARVGYDEDGETSLEYMRLIQLMKMGTYYWICVLHRI